MMRELVSFFLFFFVQEALRWWDHWLKGMNTGIMSEGVLRAYVQDSAPPRSYYGLGFRV